MEPRGDAQPHGPGLITDIVKNQEEATRSQRIPSSIQQKGFSPFGCTRAHRSQQGRRGRAPTIRYGAGTPTVGLNWGCAVARAGSRHPVGTGMRCRGAPMDVRMARWHRRGLGQRGDSGAEPGEVAGGAGSSLAPGRGAGGIYRLWTWCLIILLLIIIINKIFGNIYIERILFKYLFFYTSSLPVVSLCCFCFFFLNKPRESDPLWLLFAPLLPQLPSGLPEDPRAPPSVGVHHPPPLLLFPSPLPMRWLLLGHPTAKRLSPRDAEIASQTPGCPGRGSEKLRSGQDHLRMQPRAGPRCLAWGCTS